MPALGRDNEVEVSGKLGLMAEPPRMKRPAKSGFGVVMLPAAL